MTSTCCLRAYKFIQIFNYLTDLREADYDYSATVDHPKAVCRFFNI